jgi:hypothetical protein
MKLNRMAAARSGQAAGHRWGVRFTSRLQPSRIVTRSAARPYLVSASPHATATDETERGEKKGKKPSRRTTREAGPQDVEEAEDSSGPHLAGEEGKQHATPTKIWRSAELGLGVVTRERCLRAAERSAQWVLGLDINTNSTGFTVLHAPTGAPHHFPFYLLFTF